MRRADWDTLEAETLKLEVEIFVLWMIDLVRDQYDRSFRSPQEAREFLINRSEALLRIDDEEDDVGFAHRRIRRAPHFPEQFRFAVTSDSTRVPDHERLGAAQAECGNPVACNAGLIMHDGNVASGKPVKESGLTDVRPADDRDLAAAWFFHHLKFMLLSVRARVPLRAELTKAIHHVNDSGDEGEKSRGRDYVKERDKHEL